MGRLDREVAIITGAGSGIGRATSILFAEEGATVAVVDCSLASAQETTRMIEGAGGKAICIEADVSKAADVEDMVKATVDKCGQIDILFSNAGITRRFVATAECTEEEWDSIISVNLKGVFLCSKYVIPLMLAHGGGAIINTASFAGLVAVPKTSAYCASKAGVILLTKAMALEYASHNIRVNCICPGGIRTGMTESWMPKDPIAQKRISETSSPFGRMGHPEEVARVALFLACKDSSFVTGASLVVDAGMTAGMMSGSPSKP